jgi:hypothetical protein
VSTEKARPGKTEKKFDQKRLETYLRFFLGEESVSEYDVDIFDEIIDNAADLLTYVGVLVKRVEMDDESLKVFVFRLLYFAEEMERSWDMRKSLVESDFISKVNSPSLFFSLNLLIHSVLFGEGAKYSMRSRVSKKDLDEVVEDYLKETIDARHDFLHEFQMNGYKENGEVVPPAVIALFLENLIFMYLHFPKDFHLHKDIVDSMFEVLTLDLVEIHKYDLNIDNRAGKFSLELNTFGTMVAFIVKQPELIEKILFQIYTKKFQINPYLLKECLNRSSRNNCLVLLDNLICMSRLYQIDMKIVDELHTEYGFIWFHRYPIEILLDMHQDLKSGKKYEKNILYLLSGLDDTVSFLQSGDLFKKVYFEAKHKGIKITFAEVVGDKDRVNTVVSYLKEKNGSKFNSGVVSTHANKYNLGFSSDDSGEVLKDDFNGEWGLQFLENFTEDAELVFDGCGLGRKNGLAQKASTIFSKVYAPKGNKAALKDLELTLDKDGRVHLEPSYFGDDKIHDQPRVYVKGKFTSS